MSKTHWKKSFNYSYLGSYSLADGRDVTLTIAGTQTEMVQGEKGQSEECFVMYFSDKFDFVKPMIMNKTNCKTLEKLYTPYVEEWVGKKVMIGISQVNAFGGVHDALRIRPKVPTDRLPELTPSDCTAWEGAVNYIASGEGTIDNILKNRTVKPEHQVQLQVDVELKKGEK